jgi:hypothetical protein
MDATTSSSPITIQRLHNLRRGETMTVYRGDFDLDLNHPGAPKYKALLRQVREAMHQLERGGRIVLHTEQETIGTPPGKIVVFKRYIATGI